jgi:hypothetical protein
MREHLTKETIEQEDKDNALADSIKASADVSLLSANPRIRETANALRSALIADNPIKGFDQVEEQKTRFIKAVRDELDMPLG